MIHSLHRIAQYMSYHYNFTILHGYISMLFCKVYVYLKVTIYIYINMIVMFIIHHWLYLLMEAFHRPPLA